MPKRLIFSLFFLAGTAAAADLKQAMADVERLRGLTFLHGVAERTIDRSQLRDVLKREIAKSLPYSAEDYVKVLKAMELVDAKDPALLDKMLDLYDAQVLAFYDPVSHTYFAINGIPPAMKDMPGADALQQSVVVHELTHAMQDQRFEASVRDRRLQRDVDAELAYHALLEGEATLVMLDWLLEKTGQSLGAMVKNDAMMNMMSSAAADKTIAPGTPPYFIESLKFPYVDGLRLVVEAYRRGGWKEIDRLEANPPVSTREVIHLNEYFARVDRGEKRTSNFDPPPDSPDVLTQEHLGEFHWRFLVGAAATGWVNDRVTIGCDDSVKVETWWENADRAAAFRDAYVSFLRDRDIEPSVIADGKYVKVVYLAQ